ncbi:MAG: cobalamin B12-binding domain-containing protein [Candidatus Freyarchaeota archaeon]
MSREELLKRMADAVVNLNVEETRKLAEEAVGLGIPPLEAITEGLAKGLRKVGELFEKKEYFLADMIMAAEAFKEGMSVLTPHIKKEEAKKKGVIVIGTVKDDVHDLGKNVVSTLLASQGYDVYDLGIDVPSEEFVKKAKEVDADIVGLSALLTTTMEHVPEVIEALKEAGLRDKVKIIVGGRPLTPEFAEEVGADAYCEDAIKALEVVENLLEG